MSENSRRLPLYPPGPRIQGVQGQATFKAIMLAVPPRHTPVNQGWRCLRKTPTTHLRSHDVKSRNVLGPYEATKCDCMAAERESFPHKPLSHKENPGRDPPACAFGVPPWPLAQTGVTGVSDGPYTRFVEQSKQRIRAKLHGRQSWRSTRDPLIPGCRPCQAVRLGAKQSAVVDRRPPPVADARHSGCRPRSAPAATPAAWQRCAGAGSRAGPEDKPADNGHHQQQHQVLHVEGPSGSHSVHRPTQHELHHEARSGIGQQQQRRAGIEPARRAPAAPALQLAPGQQRGE